MNFFQQLTESNSDVYQGGAPEHAVTVFLRLSDDAFGSEEEQNRIYGLSDQLETAIATENAGEFDGDEFGDGSCTLFMYGPDADALLAAVEPILRASPLAEGAYAVKRYGEVGEVNVREVQVHFQAAVPYGDAHDLIDTAISG